MLKKLFLFLFLILMSAYLVVAVTVLNARPSDAVCSGVELVIRDSIDHGFISKREVLRLLNGKKLSPIGKPMADINTRLLEDEIRQHPLVGNAECYHTSGNRIGIEITQRVPILRVMSVGGENYYIDDRSHTMPVPGSAANVAVVTGHVSKSFAVKELYEFGMFLQRNPLWKAQIQQVHVTASGELELVPLVGEHILFLGKPGDYAEKFDRLKTFYEKGLNEIGWNKYSRISLEFDNQIICTKKEK